MSLKMDAMVQTQVIKENASRHGSSWGWIMASGIATTILGVLALVGPVAFGLAATVFFSSLLLISGGVLSFNAIRCRHQPGFGMALFTGVISLLAGAVLWMNPLAGLVTLGGFLTVYFVFSGLFRMIMSFELKPVKGWGWVFFGGLISTVMGGYLFAQLPLSGLWVVGIVLGVDLLFFGSGQIALSMQVKAFEKASR